MKKIRSSTIDKILKCAIDGDIQFYDFFSSCPNRLAVESIADLYQIAMTAEVVIYKNKRAFDLLDKLYGGSLSIYAPFKYNKTHTILRYACGWKSLDIDIKLVNIWVNKSKGVLKENNEKK